MLVILPFQHERALRDLQEQVTQLKGELQQLHATLNRKSANLDDSVGYIERLNQQVSRCGGQPCLLAVGSPVS